MERDFDVIVIGTGVAASTAAEHCRAGGRTVAVVDELPYGGTCALRGCDAKKALRRAAEVMDAAQCMRHGGIVSDGLHVDWPALAAFKRSFTDPVPAEREKRFADLGIERLHGTARFTGRTSLAVGDDRLSARHVVIAAGAKPRPLGIPGEGRVTTSTGFLDLQALPRRVVFIGGGYVSFEFAHIAARAGADVTVLTRGDRHLGGFDPDLVDRLVERSKAAGIRLQANAEVVAVERGADALRVDSRVAGEPRSDAADLVVHGAGRVPATDSLDLVQADVRAGRKGIEVNEFLQSVSNEAVYAAGDVAASAGAPLTPVAALEGRIAATNLLEGNRLRPDYTAIPSVVFTIPALARVGLLESQAREQGLDFDAKFTDMRGWYGTRRVGETQAAARTLVERGSGRILGAHLLGPESVELVDLFALAMRNGLGVREIRDFIGSYPSAASDIGSLF